MIGAALKKYAEDHGMTCDCGYIYGKVNGRYIALVDGIGVKMLQIYICPPSQADDEILTLQVQSVLESCDPRQYRMIRQNAVNVGEGRAVVVFQDGVGAMERIAGYIDEMLPKLNALETGGEACACCGRAIHENAGHILMDDYILPVHRTCIGEMAHRCVADAKKENRKLAHGAFGAVVGALVGAVVMAVVHLYGFVSGIAGWLVGFLSSLLCEKFGGRKSRVQAAVVAIAMVFGVMLGLAGGISAVFMQGYGENGGEEALGLTRLQYLQTSWELYTQENQEIALGNRYDRMCTNISWKERVEAVSREEYIQTNLNPEYANLHSEAVREFWIDFSMGLFFGALGCLGLFVRVWKTHKRHIVRKLK